jgi:hypothetical protein
MAAWWQKVTGEGSPAEEHMLTKSCAVIIPAGVKHAPIYFRKIITPIWYLATGPTEAYKKAISGKAQK